MGKPIADYLKKRFAIDDLTSSRRLLQLLDERGKITQAQGAKAMGVSVGTCSMHFQKLEYIGLIRRSHGIVGDKGRSTIVWELDKTNNFYLLLIFNVPFLKAFLIDFSGNVVLEKCEDLTGISDTAEVEERVDEVVTSAISWTKETHGHIRQVMASTPGILDPRTGVVVNIANFPVLNGMNLPSLMRQRHGLPCHCGTIGRTLYYGEIQHLPPGTSAMVVHWNLGVGAVTGKGTQVFTAPDRDALLSEMGHVRLVRDGNPCHCGQRGCLEAYVGGWAMIDALADPRIQSLETFNKAVLDGQATATAIACEAAYTLGKSLVWPLQTMQCERIVITGLVSNIFPMVRDRFIDGLGLFFTEDEISALDPVASTDASLALQQGAFHYARHQFFHPDG